MNSFAKFVRLWFIFCFVKVNFSFSHCAYEPESLETLHYIMRELNHPLSLFPHNGFESLKTRTWCNVEKVHCSSPTNNGLLNRSWLLLHDLENARKCRFGSTEWRGIKQKIMAANGERVTNESQPDIFIIPNFLTHQQCQALVNLHQEIHHSLPEKKLWKFSTTKQLLQAIYRASLSPDEYNISMSLEYCDGGILEGGDVSRKMKKVLNFSSSCLVPRGENSAIDMLEQRIQSVIGLPRTNAYHSQLLKYEERSEYKAHTDCHNISNDRMATIIIYLTDVEEGGETNFPFLNISIKPRKGMAVVWKNLDDECDLRTTHVAARVKKGEKYIYQKWFYEEPILPTYQDDALVYCDLSGSCREYIYNASTTAAVKLMKKCQTAVDYAEAFKYCEQALLKQPTHAASLILYADVLHNLGHSQEALPYVLRAIKMHPRNKDALEVLRSIVINL